MKRRIAVFLTISFLMNGCGSVYASEVVEICPDPGPGAYLFWMEPESVPAGGERAITPYYSTHPGAIEALPGTCLKNVSLSPSDSGRIIEGPGGEFSFAVSQNAPSGTTLTISADYRDRKISNRITVYDSASEPLVRYWRQDEDGCAPGSAIQELVFSADGTFSVTWIPFETRKDYWGDYSFDQETGQLDLVQESGNTDAIGLRSGTVRLVDEKLYLETASFGGDPVSGKICDNPFE